jgi:hypothetical protein
MSESNSKERLMAIITKDLQKLNPEQLADVMRFVLGYTEMAARNSETDEVLKDFLVN